MGPGVYSFWEKGVIDSLRDLWDFAEGFQGGIQQPQQQTKQIQI